MRPFWAFANRQGLCAESARREGAVVVAAQLFNGANQVAGSLCIFGHSVNVTDQRVGLRHEAGNLSRAPGQQPRQVHVTAGARK
jgi:hypothetical protein